MRLYTCAAKKAGASLPLLLKHPCGVAAKALDDAGYEYELETVGGFKALPITRRGKRDEIRELTGQEDVPVLLLDDGTTAIHGTKRIVEWARANPAA
jgi:glutaredoxin